MNIKRVKPKNRILFFFCMCMLILWQTNHKVYAQPKWPEPVFDNRKWKLGFSKNINGNRFEEYILKKEDISKWSEIITLQFMPGKFEALTFARAFEYNIKQRCPAANFSLVTNKSKKNSIIWHYTVKNCGDSLTKDQLEIGRVEVIPNKGIHVFHYATTNINLSDKDFSKWLMKLFEIKIKP